MILAFLQANPLGPMKEYGPYVGSAFVCVGLFIWSQIQIYMLRKDLTDFIKVNTESVAAQTKGAGELKTSVDALKTSIDTLSGKTHDQELLDRVRDILEQQKLLAQSQTTITQGFQRVVESLIDAVKD